MTGPLIRFENVRKAYRDVIALNDLSFTAPATGCIGLLGPNGAGKTTALKALLGLTRIDAGEITNGATRIGYLPQQPALFGWMTAEENLRFVANAVGLRGATQTERVNAWIDRLGLASAKKRRTSTFSGGMKQRLGLAAAMIQEPDVLVLDEPVSALDPIGRHEILHLVAELKKDRCVIMSTHILDDAERVCDRVVIMHQGTAILDQSIDELHHDLSPAFEIELSASPEQIAKVHDKLVIEPYVSQAIVEGAVISVLLADGENDVPALLAFLATLQLERVVRIEKRKASLEDIFLQVVNTR